MSASNRLAAGSARAMSACGRLMTKLVASDNMRRIVLLRRRGRTGIGTVSGMRYLRVGAHRQARREASSACLRVQNELASKPPAPRDKRLSLWRA